QQSADQDKTTRGQSKIPVHVQERNRERTNSLDRSTGQRNDSPRRGQWRKSRAHLSSTPIRMNSEPDVKNTDFKSVVKEYSQLSPKRINLRNKNQGFKYGLCRIEVKDKPVHNWQPWKRLGENGKWHSLENDKWYTIENGKLNTHSTKWNKQNRNCSTDQESWSSDKSTWNIECDKSEEENDQVFLSDDTNDANKEDSRRPSRYVRRESWPVMHVNHLPTPAGERGSSPSSTGIGTSNDSSESISKNSSRESIADARNRGASPGNGIRDLLSRHLNRSSSPRNRALSPRNLGTSPRKGSVCTSSSSSTDATRRSVDTETEWDSGVDSVTSKMVLIRCKEANYLTRIYLDKE
ncbi:hypothetical protein OTU49_014842, partial [Cherax quadricarinatus]